MTSVSLYIHKGGEHRDIFNRGRCTCKTLKLSIERKSRKKLLWGSFNQILFDMVSKELAKCPHGVYWDKTESFIALTTDIQGRLAGVRTDEIKSNVTDIHIPPHRNQNGFDWKNHQMESIVGFRNSWWCTRSDGGVFILRTTIGEVSEHTRAIRYSHRYDSKLKCSGKTILEKKKIVKVVHTRHRIAVLDESNEVSLFTSTTAEATFQDTVLDNVSDLFAIRDTFFLLSPEKKITMIYTPLRSEETRIIERGQEEPFSPTDVEYITSTTFEEVEMHGNKAILTETETSKTVMLNFDYIARHNSQNMGIRVIYDPELNGHLPDTVHKPVIVTKLGMFIFKHVPMFVPCFKELKYMNDLHGCERFTSSIRFFSSDELVNIENATIIAKNIGADVHEVTIKLRNGRKAENSYIFHFTSGTYKGCVMIMGEMADTRIQSIRNIEKVSVHENRFSTTVIMNCTDERVIVWGIHTGKHSKIFFSNQRSLRMSTNKLRAMGIKCEHTSINAAGYVVCPHRDHERTFSPNAIQEVQMHMFDTIKQSVVRFIEESDIQTLDGLVIGIKDVLQERLIDAVEKYTDSKNKAAKKLTKSTGLTPSVFIDTISKLADSSDLKDIIWSNTKDIFLNIATESLERAKDIMITRMEEFEAETKKDALYDYSTLLKNTEHEMGCTMWEMN